MNSHLTGQSEFRYGNKTNNSSTTYDIHEYQLLPVGHEAYWEVDEIILVIYFKLNSEKSYVPSMNEIVGPVYYNFATDSNSKW